MLVELVELDIVVSVFNVFLSVRVVLNVSWVNWFVVSDIISDG